MDCERELLLAQRQQPTLIGMSGAVNGDRR